MSLKFLYCYLSHLIYKQEKHFIKAEAIIIEK